MKEVTIALVGKYTKLEDSYASVVKALTHAAMAVDHKLNLKVGMQKYTPHTVATLRYIQSLGNLRIQCVEPT